MIRGLRDRKKLRRTLVLYLGVYYFKECLLIPLDISGTVVMPTF